MGARKITPTSSTAGNLNSLPHRSTAESRSAWMDPPMSAGALTVERPSLMESFNRQFRRPEGRLGWLAGEIMARENAALNRDVVQMLEIDPTDRVLEIGFGPGVGIAAAGRLTVDGRVAGVDLSEVMVRTARRRNRDAVRSGLVDLRRAGVEDLPFADEVFSKGFSINTIQHWSSQAQGLAELRRVIVPDGRLLLAFRRAQGSGLDPHSRGASLEDIDRFHELLGDAGFTDVRWSEQKRKREIVAFLDCR